MNAIKSIRLRDGIYLVIVTTPKGKVFPISIDGPDPIEGGAWTGGRSWAAWDTKREALEDLTLFTESDLRQLEISPCILNHLCYLYPALSDRLPKIFLQAIAEHKKEHCLNYHPEAKDTLIK